MRCWIGTSGWVYPHWRGTFYPPGLPSSEWLSHYAARFATVELNNTFYRLPSEQAFVGWAAQTPAGFRFTVKASRYLTHMKKLRDPDEPLARLLHRARLLGEKLGPLLYQLPPHWKCNVERLRAFVACLPADLTHVVEFRDPSWINEQVLATLQAHSVAFCTAGYPGVTCPLQATASIAYVRLHGAETWDASCYDDRELQWWAEQIHEALAGGREVYVYLNNDAFGYAAQNAQRLIELLPGSDQALAC